MVPIDWGNAAEWFGAALTGCAAIVAAFAYRHAVNDSEQQHADNFAFWAIEETAEGARVCFRNNNPLPVLDVEIVHGRTVLARVGTVPPGDQCTEPIAYGLGRTDAWRCKFRDASGRRWERSRDGHLTMLGRRDITCPRPARRWLAGLSVAVRVRRPVIWVQGCREIDGVYRDGIADGLDGAIEAARTRRTDLCR